MAEENGLANNILAAYEAEEEGGSDAGDFGIDYYASNFEDEFPGDSSDPVSGTFVGYSPESNRAIESRPWGVEFGDRPKIHELNQPQTAQMSGLRVVEFIPRRNRKWVFHRLAGTPTELRVITQTIQATRQLTGANIDFDQWLELWAGGFLTFTQERNVGNFQITGENQWQRIKDPKTRPFWKEWTTSFQRADFGFRAGQYWPDRSQENISFPISGTDQMLIAQVLGIEHQQIKNATGGKSNSQHWPPMKGQPRIKLTFLDASGNESEASLRIMTKTDDPKVPLPQITKADLQGYAVKIVELFAKPELFVWEKGPKVFSYKNRWQGFDGQWFLCKNETGGKTLLTKLLAIVDLTVDPSKTRLSVATDEEIAFPPNPPDVVVLGEPVKQEKERPVVDTVFSHAEIYLSKLRKPIPLVNRAVIVFK